MYLGIGFLLGVLIGIAVVPLIHSRAVRLTVRRLEAAMPLSAAELQADKDLLRAEFAMSTRRLEMNIAQLRNKTACQLVELGKKEDAINRLKIERDALEAELIVLKRPLVRGAHGVAHGSLQLPKAVVALASGPSPELPTQRRASRRPLNGPVRPGRTDLAI